jgi:deoxyinosine 3'endonuclease (endonuclease V)
MINAVHDTNRIDEDDDSNLKKILWQWEKEQIKVASQVVIHPDPPSLEQEQIHNTKYKIIPTRNNSDVFHTGLSSLYIGGVDVSFPKSDNLACAVYTILKNRHSIIYTDTIQYNVQIPYVSSYLSFREIEPLKLLVQKQKELHPNLTPHVILVDGNGIFHERKAGIATMLGVYCNIRTIGVSKNLYCFDGLQKHSVWSGIKTKLEEYSKCLLEEHSRMNTTTRLLQNNDNDDLRCFEHVVICQSPINGVQDQIQTIEKDITTDVVSTTNQSVSIDDLLCSLHSETFCHGFAVPLQGASGTIWAAALIGHGVQNQKIPKNNLTTHSSNAEDRKPQKNNCKWISKGSSVPIYISIGHDLSLQDAIQVCAYISKSRIPEPVRQADLVGRELIRQSKKC